MNAWKIDSRNVRPHFARGILPQECLTSGLLSLRTIFPQGNLPKIFTFRTKVKSNQDQNWSKPAADLKIWLV